MEGLREDAFFVEAASVVGDADDDPASLVEGLEADGAGGIFPFCFAFGGGFDAVVRGVADHVNEGVGEFFDDVAVEFGFFSGELELDFFSLGRGEIPHEAVHFLERGADGDHPERHGVVLEIGGDAR